MTDWQKEILEQERLIKERMAKIDHQIATANWAIYSSVVLAVLATMVVIVVKSYL